jgi:type IV fimbrial biogenesis protein FimT
VPQSARQIGFTLLETVITLAILAVLGAIATPSFSALVDRQRLQAAAHHLQADIALARYESAQRRQTVHLRFQTGSAWCYLLSTDTAADCRQAAAATLPGVIKLVRASESAGVRLLQANAMAFQAGNDASLQALQAGQASFSSRQGVQLRLRLGALGRASLCAPEGHLPGTPACVAPAAKTAAAS